MSLCLFSVDYAQFSLFSNFEIIKVKKATLIAGAAFFHIGLFFALKILLYYPEECFEALLTQSSAGEWRPRILKAKMYHKGHKIEKYRKKLIRKLIY